ncbi:hypothetical protein V2J09_000113 [Rumex salicifolius]
MKEARGGKEREQEMEARLREEEKGERMVGWFGLGKPVVVHIGSNKFDGKVVILPSNQGKGSATVQICLTLILRLNPSLFINLQNKMELYAVQKNPFILCFHVSSVFLW